MSVQREHFCIRSPNSTISHHSYFKSIGLKSDANLHGTDGPFVLLMYGDVAGSALLFERCVVRWEMVQQSLASPNSTMQPGQYLIDWAMYLCTGRVG